MEFWGVEVKCGQNLNVEPGEGMVLHLSQANIGESKKDKLESICVYITVGGKKLVLATLNTEKLPQQQFDLVFDTDFSISHNWKHGSVYFYGYLASNPDDVMDDEDDDESDEDIQLQADNGNLAIKPKPEKPAVEEKANASKDSASAKQVKIAEPKKDAKVEDEDESSDDDMEDEDDDDDDEDSQSGEDEGSDSDDEDSEDEKEETPKKVESGKKRPAESAKKTPVPEKKVKMATPQKTDGKKGNEHVATPHPSKKAGKPQASGNKQTPKSGGSHTCKSCNRTFGSDGALDSHTKAKHSAGK